MHQGHQEIWVVFSHAVQMYEWYPLPAWYFFCRTMGEKDTEIRRKRGEGFKVGERKRDTESEREVSPLILLST